MSICAYNSIGQHRFRIQLSGFSQEEDSGQPGDERMYYEGCKRQLYSIVNPRLHSQPDAQLPTVVEEMQDEYIM